MKIAVIALMSLSLVGCHSQPGPPTYSEPKLKSFLKGSDRLISKQFFPSLAADSFTPATEIKDGIKTVWSPGTVSFDPVIARDANGKHETYKGTRVTVTRKTFLMTTSSGIGKRSDIQSQSSVLDESEMRALDRALTYMLTLLSGWSKDGPPKVKTEATFQSLDDFSLSADWVDGSPVLLVASGQDVSEILTPEQGAKMQTAIESAIATLDAN